LAQAGRKVSVLDISKESLEFVRSSAEELGVSLEIVEADATKSLPFPDNAFDCVWSSGLLEHFSHTERLSMLREQARITRGRVISIVPNATCIAYRVGKGYQEEHGIWPYGLETPILSMQREFEASGLRVTSEYSVGAKHALSFLPPKHPMRSILSAWMESVSLEELQQCNQGYLLITIGYKVENETVC
jgi:ubiquinone/menaquinone biosynthesis C-methylase UbiE